MVLKIVFISIKTCKTAKKANALCSTFSSQPYKFLYLLCGSANQLKSAFLQCSPDVKNMLFKSYCFNLYILHLWCKYSTLSFHHIRVAYNDCYRISHNLPRYASVRKLQILNNITTFEAL